MHILLFLIFGVHIIKELNLLYISLWFYDWIEYEMLMLTRVGIVCAVAFLSILPVCNDYYFVWRVS